MAFTSLLRVALISLACVRAVTATGPVVDLGYSQYEGVVDMTLNITAFRGMRYAAPPTGSLRFQAPAYPANVTGVQQAFNDPPQCYQGTFGASPNNPLTARDVEQTEDCLFLSVYSPALNSTVPLPTIVWIHGGGYTLGSASQYNGAELVQDSNNQVVSVIIQYRLGLFGFLAGQQVKDHGALNAGLLDQEFALRWVNKHIHKFGGDPNKVAIWGVSAGAGSVLQQVVANNGNTSPPLFRAAVTSSAFLPSQYLYNHTIPQTLFNQVADQAGCNGTGPLHCLRTVDSATLGSININIIAAGFQGTFSFVPVVDGSFITQSPTDALLQGEVNGAALLSVTNTNEGIPFINQSAEYNVAEYVRNLFPLFGPAESQAAAFVYRSLGSPLDQVNAIMGDSIFKCPTYSLLEAFPGESYKAEYAILPALHSQDVINYFPSVTAFNATLIYNNTAFINAFSQIFVSFAVNLDPNDKLRPSITPVWQKWSRLLPTEMVFNRTELGAPHIAPVWSHPTSDYRKRLNDGWDGFVAVNLVAKLGIQVSPIIRQAGNSIELLANISVILEVYLWSRQVETVGCGATSSLSDIYKALFWGMDAFLYILLWLSPFFYTRLSFFLIGVRAANPPTAPVVDLGYAQYQGVVDTKLNIAAFRGIRYAAPPTGSLRFQAPAPPSTVAGVQQASNDPPQCHQGTFAASLTNPFTPRDVGETEDCLFLSVYSPALNSTAPLPTIVWIHGGGYVLGSASQYNGAELVQESNNQVVAVVIQYRLGLFGFLAGQQIKEGGALNAGLLDQEFALRWVNKNIHKFGGDPNKVTIWGQSAGAGSVLQQVVAHNGKTNPPLFRAAITSSTFLPSQYAYNARIPQALFNDVAAQAGCNCTKPLDCLRGVDSATLANININLILAGFQGTFTFVPVIDGSFITQSPTDAITQGKVNGDILLSITNTNEGVVFVNQTLEYNVTDYVRNLFPLFGAKGKQRCRGRLCITGISTGSAIFKCPTYSLLDAFPKKAYKGEYAIPPALHGDDVINYFPSFTGFGATLNYNNTAFINAFSQSFVSFAANLDPNDKLRASITPVWQKWSRALETEMVFNKTELDAPHIAPVNTSSALLKRCEFWKSVRQLTAQ
ncbi:Carboxylic ester hydrolase [Mycena venus]|uniref:Carboxylic ester hydrolase n=1 Tax=Mycena venus TaxID=2733690 RepID=A0A8H7DB06_9AGAR|nr:Carboxylic ester hydrolase [Mycena venus]